MDYFFCGSFFPLGSIVMESSISALLSLSELPKFLKQNKEMGKDLHKYLTGTFNLFDLINSFVHEEIDPCCCVNEDLVLQEISGSRSIVL